MSVHTTRSLNRPDATLFAEARRALDRTPGVPSTVHVHVDGGVLMLTGTARTPSERTAAEAAVRQALPHATVTNTISVSQRIRAEGFEPPDDRG